MRVDDFADLTKRVSVFLYISNHIRSRHSAKPWLKIETMVARTLEREQERARERERERERKWNQKRNESGRFVYSQHLLNRQSSLASKRGFSTYIAKINEPAVATSERQRTAERSETIGTISILPRRRTFSSLSSFQLHPSHSLCLPRKLSDSRVSRIEKFRFCSQFFFLSFFFFLSITVILFFSFEKIELNSSIYSRSLYISTFSFFTSLSLSLSCKKTRAQVKLNVALYS